MELLEKLGPSWTKAYKRPELAYQRGRDIGFLSILHPFHGFPKILHASPDTLTVSWCGHPIKEAIKDLELPVEVVALQYRGLLMVLADLQIRHRDLTMHNLLWHPETGVHIIDFGLAIIGNENNTVPEAYWPSRWMHCEMEDWERLAATMWELKTGKEYTKEMWDNKERPWEEMNMLPSR